MIDSLDYYDEILGGIALSLSAGGLAGFFTGVPLQYSFGAGAAVSIGLMYHGMFRNGPEG
jgi:hypothetical protein